MPKRFKVARRVEPRRWYTFFGSGSKLLVGLRVIDEPGIWVTDDVASTENVRKLGYWIFGFEPDRIFPRDENHPFDGFRWMATGTVGERNER